jgi:hypothetical protein
MLGSTQEAQRHKCPAEDCSKLLENTGSLSRHVRRYHPEILHYNGLFSLILVRSSAQL